MLYSHQSVRGNAKLDKGETGLLCKNDKDVQNEKGKEVLTIMNKSHVNLPSFTTFPVNN